MSNGEQNRHRSCLYSFYTGWGGKAYTSNYMNKFKTANVVSAVKEKHMMVSVCLSWKEGGCVLHGSRMASLGNK